MKKIIGKKEVVLLSAALGFTMVGCKKSSNNDGGEGDSCPAPTYTVGALACSAPPSVNGTYSVTITPVDNADGLSCIGFGVAGIDAGSLFGAITFAQTTAASAPLTSNLVTCQAAALVDIVCVNSCGSSALSTQTL